MGKNIFSFICIILGSLALSAFYLTNWANTLIFDTNYYLKVVTPLPKDATISKALSTYTVDTLFKNINVEERIRTALPEQAAFIAPTLTDELQSRSYTRTNNIIQSDQFSSLWVAANTVFHQRVLTIVRGGGVFSQLKEKEPLQNTSVQFDASSLVETIKNQLGSESTLFTNAQIEQFRSIAVPAYTRLENIRQVVFWISQFAAMLLPLSLALLLSGIAISVSRQKALVTTGIIVIFTMLISLITLQIIKTDVLSQITQDIYNQAAQTVWDSFVSPLTQKFWLTIIIDVVLILFALPAGQHSWAINLRKTLGVAQLQKSESIKRFTNFRISLARYGLWLQLLGVFIAIVVLFGIENIMIANVIMILSYLLIYLAILHLIFPRQKVTQTR